MPRKQSNPHRGLQFTCERLVPEHITPLYCSERSSARSDNGTNFIGAVRELREAMEEMDHDKITEKLHKQQIDWRFNPPGASHMGGV